MTILSDSVEPIPLTQKYELESAILLKQYKEEEKMAGRFEGLSDLEWKLFEDLLPQSPEKRGRGMPHAPFRKVLNTQLYVLITGCRWCDIPRGEQWASKSSASAMAQEVVRRWNARKTKKADFGSGRRKRNDRLEVRGRRWLFFPLGKVAVKV